MSKRSGTQGMEPMPLLLYFFSVLIEVSQCLEIIDISVPNVIRNDSRASVVLDCEFRYEEYEVDGLEVKWFWNGEPEPVYQWLPGEKPEAMSILKGRVNLRHRASKDRNSVHRAIEILEPTTDLTGNYMCRVSSFHDEDFASRKMIVYAPARSMNLTFVKIKRRAVNFFCAAVGAFPEPKLKLVLLKEDKIRVIKPRRIETTKDALGAFDIFLEATVRDKTLPKEALIQCVLEIPNTGYRIRRQVVYFPDYTYRGYDVGSVPALPCSLIPLSTLLLYPSQYLISNYI